MNVQTTGLVFDVFMLGAAMFTVAVVGVTWTSVQAHRAKSTREVERVPPPAPSRVVPKRLYDWQEGER